jgi:hypothetical protein
MEESYKYVKFFEEIVAFVDYDELNKGIKEMI